ncbi:MAG: energy transducer TonB [Coraliomargaritaceae bacterium]
MAKTFKSLKESKKNRNNSIIIGIAVSFLLFLAIPLTQIFNEYNKSPESIDSYEVAPPPPPPPPEDPPPPPEPEEEEPPPELDSPPPPISLEQLDMALEPGTGGALSGDFALPSFDARKTNLGMDIFDINDLEKKPQARRLLPPRYPAKAKASSIEGFVLLEFIVDQNGDVESVVVKDSSHSLFEAAAVDAVRNWVFTPGEKDGRKVRTRCRQKIPFTIQ